MTRAILQNFRGMRAGLRHPADANRATLDATLRRLGLDVIDLSAAEGPPPGCDIVFFDADEGSLDGLPEAPRVAVIGIEAPSRLIRVVRQRCAGHLMKPVRAAGVFTALFLAVNEHAARGREAEARAALSERVQGRRHLTKALLRLMALETIDDDEAYRRLRREAMRRRIPVERYAALFLTATDPEAIALPPSGGASTPHDLRRPPSPGPRLRGASTAQ